MACNIAVIGTSHVCDDHFENDPLRYNNKTESTWPHYLAEKAGFDQAFNLGLSGFGIDTYFTRIDNLLYNYDVDTVLLEIPSAGRHQILLNNENYKYGDHLKKNWVNENGADLIRDYMLCFGCHETLKDVTTLRKIDKFNKKLSSDSKLPYYLFESFLEFSLSYNLDLEDDTILIKCKTLDAYLKYKSINTVWFNFDNYAPVTSTDEIQNKVWGGYRLADYAHQQYGWYNKNKDDYSDGVHLNSEKWRILVDDLFVDIFKNR